MTLRAAQIRGELTKLVADMDLAVISGSDAAVLVREYSLIEKIAASARTLAAARVAETSAWVGHGDRSAEDWLSRETGTSVSAAARDLRTGKQVKDQPKTEAAMKQGDLSPEQAGAVAEAVAVDPAAEAKLIDTAKRETFKNLQDQARRTRAAATDSAERTKRHHRERSARMGTDADGAFYLSLRGPAADGARVMALIKPLQEQAFLRARSNTAVRETFDNRTYDCVLAILLGQPMPSADTATAGSAPADSTPADPVPADPAPASPAPPHPATEQPTTSAAEPDGEQQRSEQPGSEQPGSEQPSAPAAPAGTDEPSLFDTDLSPAPAPRSANPPAPEAPPPETVRPPTRLPGGNNTKIIVRVDLDALLRGHTTAGETSEIAGLGPIPITVVQDMLHDAFLAVVVHKGRDVVSVAHHGRGLNAHQRTALEAQNLRCSNIACNQSVGIQIDHRHPWVKDQTTKLDNQDPLCGPCHRQKTHQGWRLEPGTGPRRFLPPARAG